MGSAYYYLKATFPKPLKKKEVGAITKFFLEGSEAEYYCQQNLNLDKSPENFWLEFKKKFPIITLYLQSIHIFGGGTEYLSGNINFGSDIENLYINGPSLTYYAEVWHFATWDPIGNFLISHFGAINYKYLSDEYLDPIEMLEQEETNEIVNDLLKQKEILPTLIGINPLLDARIAETLEKK